MGAGDTVRVPVAGAEGDAELVVLRDTATDAELLAASVAGTLGVAAAVAGGERLAQSVAEGDAAGERELLAATVASTVPVAASTDAVTEADASTLRVRERVREVDAEAHWVAERDRTPVVEVFGDALVLDDGVALSVDMLLALGDALVEGCCDALGEREADTDPDGVLDVAALRDCVSADEGEMVGLGDSDGVAGVENVRDETTVRDGDAPTVGVGEFSADRAAEAERASDTDAARVAETVRERTGEGVEVAILDARAVALATEGEAEKENKLDSDAAADASGELVKVVHSEKLGRAELDGDESALPLEEVLTDADAEALTDADADAEAEVLGEGDWEWLAAEEVDADADADESALEDSDGLADELARAGPVADSDASVALAHEDGAFEGDCERELRALAVNVTLRENERVEHPELEETSEFEPAGVAETEAGAEATAVRLGVHNIEGERFDVGLTDGLLLCDGDFELMGLALPDEDSEPPWKEGEGVTEELSDPQLDADAVVHAEPKPDAVGETLAQPLREELADAKGDGDAAPESVLETEGEGVDEGDSDGTREADGEKLTVPLGKGDTEELADPVEDALTERVRDGVKDAHMEDDGDPPSDPLGASLNEAVAEVDGVDEIEGGGVRVVEPGMLCEADSDGDSDELTDPVEDALRERVRVGVSDEHTDGDGVEHWEPLDDTLCELVTDGDSEDDVEIDGDRDAAADLLAVTEVDGEREGLRDAVVVGLKERAGETVPEWLTVLDWTSDAEANPVMLELLVADLDVVAELVMLVVLDSD